MSDQQQQPYSAPPGYGGYPQPAKGSNGMAIAGLVCGIVGLLILNIILGPLAIIFGGIGLSRSNKGASGRGMAIAGIVLGIVDLVVWILILALRSNSNGFTY